MIKTSHDGKPPSAEQSTHARVSQELHGEQTPPGGKTTLENGRLGPDRDASWELAHGHPNPYTPTSPMSSIPQSGCKVCVKER